MKHHGVAYGMFTGDEHLSGNGPTQGTETCAVVELMYTLETLLTCDVPVDGLGDILEKLAFNALPGAMSPDMLLVDTTWYEVLLITVTSVIGMYGVTYGLSGFGAGEESGSGRIAGIFRRLISSTIIYR